MDVRHTLICFFFLSLQDENTGLINAQITVYSQIEGGDITVKCSFSYSGSRKFFCREECKQNILIETTRDKHRSGRYSIEYTGGSLYVIITQLTKSDSGLYWCGLGSTYKQIEIIVVDAWLDGNAPDVTTIYKRPGGNVVVECSFTIYGNRKYFCKDECEEKDILVETTGDKVQKDRYSFEFFEGSSGGYLYVDITQLTKSDSGLYRCGSGTTRLTRPSDKQFEIIVVDAMLDGNEEEVTTISERPGGNIIVECSFTDYEDRKYICKDKCEEKDILVETTDDKVQDDRYSIDFRKGFPTGGSLYVGITQLTKSDSGLYGCGLDIPLSPDPIRRFNIIVTDPTTSKPPPAFTTPVPSTSTPTSTQSDQPQTGTTPSTGVLLYVIVILVIAVIIIMGLALTIICIQRKNRPDGLRTRGNSDGTKMEVYDYENCPAVHNHEDSTYQSLNPATMDEDQTYSTLTHT